MTAGSRPSVIVGTLWPLLGEPGSPSIVDPNGTAQAGIGAFPLVLDSTSSTRGRLVLGYALGNGAGISAVTASDTGGGAGTWLSTASLGPRRFDRYFDGVHTQNISGVGSPPPLHGPSGQIVTFSWPSLAADPNANNNVIAVWAGSLTQSPPLDPDHLVLFAALSTDAGAPAGSLSVLTFPIASELNPNLPNQRWVLPGALFNLPGEQGQNPAVFFPSVAIDGLGGVDLLFLRSLHTGHCNTCPVAKTSVRFARWNSVADLAAGTAPQYIHEFEPPFTMFSPGTNNDYHMVSASGCDIYVAWSRQEADAMGQPTGQWDAFAAHLLADGSCALNRPR
jgi:hypothetical protein